MFVSWLLEWVVQFPVQCSVVGFVKCGHADQQLLSHVESRAGLESFAYDAMSICLSIWLNRQ